MGLKLLARYYDRNEAVVVAATLDAAGVPAFLENYHQISAQPFGETALGGCLLMVCEQDLSDALSVIDEASRKRSFEGERLATNHRPSAFGVSLLARLMVFGFAAIVAPLRTQHWHDVGG